MVVEKQVQKGFLEKLGAILTPFVLTLDALAIVFAIVLFGIPSFFYGIRLPQFHLFNVDDLRFWISLIIGMNAIVFLIPKFRQDEIRESHILERQNESKKNGSTISREAVVSDLWTSILLMRTFCVLGIFCAYFASPETTLGRTSGFACTFLGAIITIGFLVIVVGSKLKISIVFIIAFILSVLMSTFYQMQAPISISYLVETSSARKYEAMLSSAQISVKEREAYQKEQQNLLEQKTSARKELIERLTKTRDGFKELGNEDMVKEIQSKINEARK